MDRFDRTTFESVEFITESAETPKIKSGGSSSSNILNRFFAAIAQDISLLATRANILALRSSRVEKACAEQSAALLASLQSLSTRVDAASAYSMVLADIHSTTYVSSASTANIDYTFGQATLPILSTTDLLVQTDVYGNAYVSPEVSWSYSTKAVSSIDRMSIIDFVSDPDGIFMLRDEQTWIRDTLPNQTRGWMRLKAPLMFRGLTPNVLEIWPFPAFGMKIRKVSYRKAADPEDTWYNLDLSYAPQYNAATTSIDFAGPVRLFLPNEAISELVIEVDTTSVDVWGIKKLKVYHREYSSTGILTVYDPYARTIGNITLRGKDPATLSTLSTSKLSNSVSITLTSTNNIDTPVITGVIMTV